MLLRKHHLTSSQKTGLFVYILLFVLTLLATGGSISESFSIPIYISFLFGFAIVSLIGISTSIIKDCLNSKKVRISKLISSSLLLVLLLAFSIFTNTHYFFLALKGDEIARNEIAYAETELSNLGHDKIKLVDNLISGYELEGAKRINDFYHETLNRNNYGIGPISDSLKKDVAVFLGVEDFSSLSGQISNKVNVKIYAEAMTKKMWKALNEKVKNFRNQALQIKNCKDSIQTIEIINDLRALNNYSTDFSGAVFKDKITQAHLFYQTSNNCINNALYAFNQTDGSEASLEIPVPIVKLQKLDELPLFVKHYPKEDPGKYLTAFFYCLAIAFLTDISGIMVLFLVVLKKE